MLHYLGPLVYFQPKSIWHSNLLNHIGGVVVSVLALRVVDCGFKPWGWSNQAKNL